MWRHQMTLTSDKCSFKCCAWFNTCLKYHCCTISTRCWNSEHILRVYDKETGFRHGWTWDPIVSSISLASSIHRIIPGYNNYHVITIDIKSLFEPHGYMTIQISRLLCSTTHNWLFHYFSYWIQLLFLPIVIRTSRNTSTRICANAYWSVLRDVRNTIVAWKPDKEQLGQETIFIL